jgi:hypothetical protein
MKTKKLNWVQFPDPLTEEQVHIQLSWTADEALARAHD